MDPTFTDRSFQDSPGKYLEESRPRNRSTPTWTSPRGASCRPDSNRRAWPQAPGAGGRGVPKTLVQGEAFAALCVCVWGGAGCWEGRAHVRKRGIAWRGANGARAVGAPPPRVVTACGRGGGLWLSLLFAACRALVDLSRAFACSLRRPDVRPTRVSASTGALGQGKATHAPAFMQ